ncbi:MAG: hypothetical protein CMC83_00590 [Flavobacteriaceae bacterium]|nr:hypothetical protein [Flavobacteriaceae bacterium]
MSITLDTIKLKEENNTIYKMKKWYIFYITLIISLLSNAYFGIYNGMWIMYAEAINMFGISILCLAIAYELYSKKKK